MRTTLDIDDDVLVAVKELAAAEGVTAGRLVSDMLRRALTAEPPAAGPGQGFPPGFGPSFGPGFGEEQQAMLDDAKTPFRTSADGWVVLGRRGGLVTNELVRGLQDDAEQEDLDRALAPRRQYPGRADGS